MLIDVVGGDDTMSQAGAEGVPFSNLFLITLVTLSSLPGSHS
jgi:hypothetical protein